jgi:hypothetical protein
VQLTHELDRGRECFADRHPGHFVEEQHAGLGGEGSRQLQALALAVESVRACA